MTVDRLNVAIRWCALVVLLGIIAFYALQVLQHLRTLFTILIGAVLFAYLVHPAITALRRRLPLGAAVAIVYLGIVALLVVAGLIVVPAIASDAQSLARDLPHFAADAQRIVTDPNDPLTARLPNGAREWLTELPTNLQANAAALLNATLSRAFPVLFSIVSIGALFVLIPVVSAYVMLEASALREGFVRLFAPTVRARVDAFISDVDGVIGGFIRGQVIVAAIVGSLVTILLLVLHVPYAALIGLLAGVLDVIPYVGAVAGWLPAFGIAFFVNGWSSALFVTVGIVAINQLEGHLLAPVIVSRSVKLAPLAVLLALLAGGELAGIPGLLLAVPIAGIVRVAILALARNADYTPESAPSARTALSAESETPTVL